MPLFATRTDLESTWSAARVAALVSIKGGDADAVITAALTAASEIAVGYLVSRYRSIADLAASACPAPLKEAVCKIALHSIGLAANHLSEDVDIERSRAIAYLRDVGKGAADLGLAGSPPEDLGAGNAVFTDATGEASDLASALEGWLR